MLKNITLRDGIYIFIITALSVVLFLRKSKVDKQLQTYEQRFDSLSNVIKLKLDSVSKYYDVKLDSINHRVDTSYVKIQSNDKKIQDLQNKYDKEVPIINAYTDKQLEDYFSNY